MLAEAWTKEINHLSISTFAMSLLHNLESLIGLWHSPISSLLNKVDKLIQSQAGKSIFLAISSCETIGQSLFRALLRLSSSSLVGTEAIASSGVRTISKTLEVRVKCDFRCFDRATSTTFVSTAVKVPAQRNAVESYGIDDTAWNTTALLASNVSIMIRHWMAGLYIRIPGKTFGYAGIS